MPVPERPWRPEVRTLWSMWGNHGGISMHGADFRHAYDEWETAHTLGFTSMAGPLYRQRKITWLGWTVHTPWRVYAVNPGVERYRQGDLGRQGLLR